MIRRYRAQILIAAPQLMGGYGDRPGETAEVFRRDQDGTVWLHTSDVGSLDPDVSARLPDIFRPGPAEPARLQRIQLS